MKKDLKENLQEDMEIARGAMREIISHNRVINTQLVENFEASDFSLLEEYGIITKGILDASKLLTEMNSQNPKTLQELEKIKDEKKDINLNDLVDEDDEDDEDDS